MQGRGGQAHCSDPSQPPGRPLTFFGSLPTALPSLHPIPRSMAKPKSSIGMDT